MRHSQDTFRVVVANPSLAFGDEDLRFCVVQAVPGQYRALTPAGLVDFEPGRLPHEGTMHLTREDAETLVNRLWELGVRPAGATGSIGAMAAVQEHLKDLRKLVFETSRIEFKA